MLGHKAKGNGARSEMKGTTQAMSTQENHPRLAAGPNVIKLLQHEPGRQNVERGSQAKESGQLLEARKARKGAALQSLQKGRPTP